MEEETYHFEKDSISLDDIKKDDEVCLSFIDDQQESVAKTINYENEIENMKNESITETSLQESTLKSKLCDDDISITISSITSLNSVSQEDNKSKLVNELKYENTDDLFQAEHIVPMVEIKQEPFKGSCRLVRLQAATDPQVQPAARVAYDVKISNEKDLNICSENLSKNLNENDIGELLTSQTTMSPEGDYQFLTPKVPSRQQACVTTTTQFTGSNFQPYLSSNQTNSNSTSNSMYECRSSNRFGVPHTDTPILRYDKVQTRPNDIKISGWINNSSSSGDSSTGSLGVNNDSSFQYSVNTTQESSPVFTSVPNVSENQSSSPQMQRFLTADNQIVYGYKDPNGEFHFFCNNERESHNEKERKRRSRVSEACSALRKIIPGMSDKTDKATVFEQAASYLKFLREKFGMQFDQAYCEKYFQERS